MNLSFYRLNDLLFEGDGAYLRVLLSSFRCSSNPDAESFLKNTAITHEKNGISRTYVLLEGDDFGNDPFIKGFFTLAVKCLTVNKQHSIPDKIYAQMNVNRGIAQAYLLGQLAKTDGAEKGFGKEMIERALDIFARGNKMFGCRVVRLDCKDQLIDYYESCGFTYADKSHNGALNQMITII